VRHGAAEERALRAGMASSDAGTDPGSRRRRPTMFARIGIMRALNRGKPSPDLQPRRKAAKAYKELR